MTSRVADQRVHTGSFQGEQMQRQAREASTRVNQVLDVLDGRVDIARAQDWTTTAATAQTVKNFTFPVLDGECWCVEFWGLAGCSGSANGMKYAIGAPPRSTVSGVLDSSLTNAIDDAHVQFSAPDTLTSAVHTVNGGFRDDYINVRIKVAGNGAISLRACSTTATNTTTIKALAYMRAKKFDLV